MDSLEGKVVIVTGSARGQGAAEARLFAGRGANVVVTDVLDDEGEQLAKEIGPSTIYMHLDVSQEAAWHAVVTKCEETFGRLDILINNAGIATYSPILTFSTEAFLREISILQLGPFLGMRSCAPAIARAGGGSIVNIASINGAQYAFANTCAYTGAKAALIGMTKVAALEFGSLGIRVNVISPGGIATDIEHPAGGLSSAHDALPVFKTIPIPRMGSPIEVARLAAFLASDESSYCTGAEFVIDGGWTIGSMVLADASKS